MKQAKQYLCNRKILHWIYLIGLDDKQENESVSGLDLTVSTFRIYLFMCGFSGLR